MTRVRRAGLVEYSIAAGAVAAAALCRWLFDPLLGDDVPFLTFFPAVIAAAWLGGRGPAAFAAVASTVIAWYFFIPPRFAFGVEQLTGQRLLSLVLFFAVCALISALGEAMRTAHARVQRNAEELAVTLASIGDAVIATDTDGRVTRMNPVAEALTGWRVDEAAGRPLDEVFRIINEGTRATVASPVDRVLAEGCIVGLANHTTLIARDGTERAIDDSAAPIRDADKQLQGVVLTFRDVTEERRAEHVLRQSEERHRFATRATKDTIWDWDMVKDEVVWSEALHTVFGYPPEQAGAVIRDAFEWWTAHIHADDRKRVGESFQRAADRGSNEWYEHYRFLRADGSYAEVVDAAFLVYDTAGKPIRITGAMTDVTERKRVEEALRTSEEKYRLLFESIDEGFCTIQVLFDDDGKPFDYRFLDINPAFVQQTDLTDAVGKTMLDFAPQMEAHWFEAYGRVAMTGEPVRFENRAEQLHRWYEVYAFRIGAPEERKVGVLFDDITERKQAEEALLDANRRKDEFLATLAHELRNPLGPIRNAIQILNVVAAHEPTARKAREVIDRQSAHMARLIDDLLDVARITHGKLEIKKTLCDLAAIVREACEDYRASYESAGLELRVEIPDQHVWVQGDPTRLNQIVGNVLHNSLKFTEFGGQVSVRVQYAATCCEIRIFDTGIGMDKETLDRMFHSFNQADRSLDRSRGGLGLGLALVKHLVELHGGHVSASSAGLGRGSEFTLVIPFEPTRVPPQEAAAVRGKLAGPLRVVVIEDNDDAAETLCALLQLQGHLTEKALNGRDGLDVVRRTRPHIVLCDIGLPGLDGYAVARALRQEAETAGVYLIALTGYGQQEDQRRTREAGFDLHLVKPVDYTALEMALAMNRASFNVAKGQQGAGSSVAGER